MKNRLVFKFFLAFLGIGIIVAMAIVFGSRISFMHNFSRYAEKQEMARMESIAQNLSDAYADQETWQFLSSSPRTWQRFVGNMDMPPSMKMGAIPPPSGEPPQDKNRPPRMRIALIDMNQHLLAGRMPDHEGLRIPVMQQKQQIGWLVTDGPRPRQARDVAFLAEQTRHAWMIAVSALLIAGIVAFLLSRHMIAPIKAITQATHKLAGGHYDTRVPISTSDEIGKLAQDFNQLAVTLARNEQMRRSYMADISHDLRTPIAILRGELEAMEDGLKPASTENIKALQSEVLTLTRLVEDLHALALSDLGALTYRMDRLDLFPLLRSCISAFSIRMQEAGITLESDLPNTGTAFLSGDNIRLTQLINNLLENSLRHTTKPGQTKISCHTDNNTLCLICEDSAPAPSEEKLNTLLATDTLNRKGLGLAICRKIVEAHHGNIDASLSELGGLRITITLPLQNEEAA